MDIRLNAYKSYNSGKVTAFSKKDEKSSSKASEAIAPKCDVVSISQAAAEKSALSKAGATIRSDISALSSSDRVSAIKAQVQSGSYSVSSEEIASAILERFV